jgi:hypothetical protein
MEKDKYIDMDLSGLSNVLGESKPSKDGKKDPLMEMMVSTKTEDKTTEVKAEDKEDPLADMMVSYKKKKTEKGTKEEVIPGGFL